MISFRKIVGHYDLRYPALDPTTPHYEWLSYTECCASLDVRPSLTRFLRYNAYYRSIQNEQDPS